MEPEPKKTPYPWAVACFLCAAMVLLGYAMGSVVAGLILAFPFPLVIWLALKVK
jgi:hypothetical protein